MREPDPAVVIRENTNEEYHEDVESIGSSMLKVFDESPRDYEARFVTQERPPFSSESKPHLDLGTVAHSCILEGEIGENVVEIPKDALTSNGARRGKAWDKFKAENEGKILLLEADFETLRRIVESVLEHPVASTIFERREDALPERSLYWEDDETGLPMKARLDWPLPDENLIADLKTTGAATLPAWIKIAANLKYHLSDAVYSEGFSRAWPADEDPSFVFVVAMTEEPFRPKVVELAAEDRELGRRVMRRILGNLKERVESGDFAEPGEDEVLVARLPRWAHTAEEV